MRENQVMRSLHPGQRVVRWTILGAAPIFPSPGRRRYRWLCRCDCGTEKLVLDQSLRLALRAAVGGSRSCGCLAVEMSTSHGNAANQRPTVEYYAWTAAKKRCNNPRNASYRHYGARGIHMCSAWSASFETFLRDMGEKPSAIHSLDRIDPNGNYAPGNCRWALPIVQARNKRSTRWFAFEGERLILADLAARLGITRDQARTFERRGSLPAWQIVGALEDPINSPNAVLIDLNDAAPLGEFVNVEANTTNEAVCCQVGAR